MLFGLGNGTAFVPLTALSLTGVRPEDAGAGSGLVNVMQQVGGTLGLAIMVSVFGHASGAASVSGTVAERAQQAFVHGADTAFEVAAGFLALTVLLVAVLVRGPAQARRRRTSPIGRRPARSSWSAEAEPRSSPQADSAGRPRPEGGRRCRRSAPAVPARINSTVLGLESTDDVDVHPRLAKLILAGSGFDFGAVAGPEGVEDAVAVDAAVGVGAEEVALALDQRGRQALGPQAVVVGQGRGEARSRDPGLRPHRPPPDARTPAPAPTASVKYGASSSESGASAVAS